MLSLSTTMSLGIHSMVPRDLPVDSSCNHASSIHLPETHVLPRGMQIGELESKVGRAHTEMRDQSRQANTERTQNHRQISVRPSALTMCQQSAYTHVSSSLCGCH